VPILRIGHACERERYTQHGRQKVSGHYSSLGNRG
jgi:hypothetical protein